MSDSGNPRINLVSGQLSTFTRLSTLGDFDLQLLSIDQVITRHAETSRSNLFDRAVARISVGIANVTRRVFPSLTSVALRADSIHRDRQGFMSFATDGTVRHRACFKPLSNRLNRFD